MNTSDENTKIISELSKLIDVLKDASTNVAPLVGDRNIVADILGVSDDQVSKMSKSGKLPLPIIIGKTKKWYLPEIKLWLAYGAPVTNKWEVVKKNLNFEERYLDSK